MKLKVLRYDAVGNYHHCEDEAGNWLTVDFFTAGDIEGETNETIVGKVVTCERLRPYFQFAEGVKRVEATEQATQEA